MGLHIHNDASVCQEFDQWELTSFHALHQLFAKVRTIRHEARFNKYREELVSTPVVLDTGRKFACELANTKEVVARKAPISKHDRRGRESQRFQSFKKQIRVNNLVEVS